jgi:hypothetical protein
MTDLKSVEEVEEIIEEQRHVIDSLGFIDFAHFLQFKVCAVAGMLNYGNDFERTLGKLLHLANVKDSVRIIHAWRNTCMQYEMAYKIEMAKLKAG